MLQHHAPTLVSRTQECILSNPVCEQKQKKPLHNQAQPGEADVSRMWNRLRKKYKILLTKRANGTG